MKIPDNAQQILDSYPFPRRFCVTYALACAKDCLEFSNEKDMPVAKACIEVVERWLRGEATEQECRDTAASISNVAYAYATYATYATYVAYAATYAATYAASAAYATAYTDAAAARAAGNHRPMDYYRDLLLTMIQTELTELERVMLGLS